MLLAGAIGEGDHDMARTAAVIDVGSNTVRLLVARCSASSLLPTHTERVRLGLAHEIEEDEAIGDANIAAAAEAVRDLCARARGCGAESVEVLVTAPGRQAQNGAELVEAIQRESGQRVRVLSAEEEARLAFAGAVAGAEPSARLVAVADLGGASTELAVGRPEAGPAWLRSIDLGALRLTARFLQAGQPDADQVDAARVAVAEAFAGTAPPLPGAALVVGGSARALGRVLGPILGRGELETAVSMLPLCPPDAIADRFGIGKRRAPLLLAAALILAEVQRRFAVPLLVVEGGIREGALLAQDEAAAA